MAVLARRKASLTQGSLRATKRPREPPSEILPRFPLRDLRNLLDHSDQVAPQLACREPHGRHPTRQQHAVPGTITLESITSLVELPAVYLDRDGLLHHKIDAADSADHHLLAHRETGRHEADPRHSLQRRLRHI